ncbi:MAG TPA: zf-HC2 domain-containing protein, partial [Candidatus Sulfotelmatobacter sp.]|nr:zf-HC2 domain-containing protein [Candidatus Sulfotelmatobacter sp.]
MNCEWQEKSNMYVDGELDQAAQQAFAAHLQSCPACSSTVLEQQELKKAVRLAGRRYSAPPDLYAEIRKGTSHAGAKSWRLWRWVAACAVLMAALGWGWYASTRGENATTAQVVDLHVIMLASVNPIDVISEDTHTVK